jgi:hypothetical protein
MQLNLLDVAKVGTTTLLDDLVSEYYFLFNEQSIITNYKLGLSPNTTEVATLLRQTSLADPLVDDLVLLMQRTMKLYYPMDNLVMCKRLESSIEVESLTASLEISRIRPNRLFTIIL